MMYEVMIVDDNPIDVLINSRVVQLAKICNTISTKNSGEGALIDLQSRIEKNIEMPWLILLDVMMPQMGGLEFLIEFEKFPHSFISEVKIIMVSSSLDKNDYDAAMKNKNVIDFINKPLSAEKLKAVFEETI